MTIVLLATDSDNIAAEVDATLANDDCDVLRVSSGKDVLPVVEARNPDLVLLDLQIGTKGGVAACIDLQHDIAEGRAEPTKVLMLLSVNCFMMLGCRST